MQDVNQIQALSLTQNLSLGSYLPSLPIDYLGLAINHLSSNDWNPSDSGKKNLFGFYRADLCYKLLQYLGYGNIIRSAPSDKSRWWSTSLQKTSNSNYTQGYIQNNYVNLFPLLAYQKIYQDFFRWSQWENANPASYNVDYFTGVTPSLVSDFIFFFIISNCNTFTFSIFFILCYNI